MWGVDLAELQTRFGMKLYDYFIKNAQKYINLNHLLIKNNNITLTHAGIFISDGIVSDLMIV